MTNFATPWPRRLAVLAAATALTACAARCQASQSAGALPEPPRLVVLIVIDQLRYDYLQRFDQHFSRGGFRRFLQDGATFSNARYLHSTTDTCPGHAVIGTGYWGNANGIIANRWFDTERDREVDCARAGRAERALNLLRPTVGDSLKEADGRSKVIVASSKRAAAVILGGQQADAVVFPKPSGEFQRLDDDGSSPAWLQAFNEAHRSQSRVDRSWTRALPEQAYPGPDEVAAEAPPEGLERSFPHSLAAGLFGLDERVHAILESTPFADETLVSLAESMVRGEGLGRDAIPDLLALSFSATDRVGHGFGPDSHEVMDTVVRLDRYLSGLLDYLDQEVGLDHTLVVLTADHGVAPLPEIARSKGVLAAGRIVEGELVEAVARSMSEVYGVPLSGAWIAFHDFPNIFLDENTLRAEGVPVEEAERVARDAVLGLPGIRAAYTRSRLRELAGGDAPSRDLRMMLRSFRPDRSGHVVYQALPYNVATDTGTNHGSHWYYDRHVPLLWLGAATPAGDHERPVSPADIAPTIRAILGLAPDPEAPGRVLQEVLPAPAR